MSRSGSGRLRLAALLVAVWGLVGLDAPTPTGAGPSQVDFTPGSGSGTGRIAAVQVRSSGVSVAVVIGRATARYQGSQGNAESSIFDPGLLGTLWTVPLVCGFSLAEIVPVESLPQPLTASSGGGEASERSDVGGDAAAPVQFGSQSVAAGPSSRAEASVEGVALHIPGVISVSGGTVDSQASLTPGRARNGRSQTDIGSVDLGGGIVRLGDLTWSAEHRTGEDAVANASFTIGSMHIAGLRVPVGSATQLAQSVSLANVALAAVGVEISVPERGLSDDSSTVSPMRVTLEPTRLLLSVLAPLNEQIQPLRTALLDLLAPFSVGEDCSLTTVVGFAYLVIDLVATAISSGGGVDLLLGGASAGTDDTSFANPFGPPPPPTTPPPTSSAPTTSEVPMTAPSTTVPTPTTVNDATEIAAPAAVGVSTTACFTTHSQGRPGCSAGAAQVAGGLALILVGLLSVTDRIRSRPTGPRRERS